MSKSVWLSPRNGAFEIFEFMLARFVELMLCASHPRGEHVLEAWPVSARSKHENREPEDDFRALRTFGDAQSAQSQFWMLPGNLARRNTHEGFIYRCLQKHKVLRIIRSPYGPHLGNFLEVDHRIVRITWRIHVELLLLYVTCCEQRQYLC